MIKQRTQEELDYIKWSWAIHDDGIIYWARKSNQKNIGAPISVVTSKSGHQNCYLYFQKKLIGYSTGQIAWFLHNNEWPTLEVDHIDGNPQNNRKDNLRLATRAEQCRNRSAGRKGRKNKGVYKREYGGKWTAQIWLDGVCKTIGTFDSEEEAVNARMEATLELHREFANVKSYALG